MRKVEINNNTVRFIELENNEIVYDQTQEYINVEQAQAAARNFLNEYTDFIPFDIDIDLD
jgi:hypothetical protein